MPEPLGDTRVAEVLTVTRTHSGAVPLAPARTRLAHALTTLATDRRVREPTEPGRIARANPRTTRSSQWHLAHRRRTGPRRRRAFAPGDRFGRSGLWASHRGRRSALGGLDRSRRWTSTADQRDGGARPPERAQECADRTRGRAGRATRSNGSHVTSMCCLGPTVPESTCFASLAGPRPTRRRVAPHRPRPRLEASSRSVRPTSASPRHGLR